MIRFQNRRVGSSSPQRRSFAVSRNTRSIPIQQGSNWEVRVAAISALISALALLFSGWQEWDGQEEERRIRTRDFKQISILSNTYKNSIAETRRISVKDQKQTAVLINTYKQLLVENKRLRKKDSIQTELLIEEGKNRKFDLEIKRKNSRPFFFATIGVETSKDNNNGYMPFDGNVVVKNVGIVAAQITNVSYFVVTVDVSSNKVLDCSKLQSKTFTREINPGKVEKMEGLSVQVPYASYYKSNYVKKEKYSKSHYVYIIITRIKSDDKFVTDQYDQFFATVFESSEYGRNQHNFSPCYNTIKYSKLKKCILENEFNYVNLINQLGSEYTYLKAQYYFYN